MKHTQASSLARAASAVFPELVPASGNIVVRSGSRVPRLRADAIPHAPGRQGSITATVMSFADIHLHGDLLVKYLRARREIFIDRLHWNVAQADGMEFDQYDTPFCRWIVLHEFGEVLGGVRLLPTVARSGIYSYMLRDAQRRLLPDIPSDLLFINAPVDPLVWEASRFFVTDLVPAVRRPLIQRMLFEQMSLAARENGALHILGIVPSVWARWARRLGADATPIGAKFSIDETWSQAVLFSVDDFLADPLPPEPSEDTAMRRAASAGV